MDAVSNDLQRLWDRARAHLERARDSLTNPHDDELSAYEYELNANELGLALEALVDVATRQRAPGTVWGALSAAAGEMKLGPEDEVHGQAVRKIREHVASAQEWFELRDLLNNWDPIGVFDPETNFPADEYECLETPLMGRLRAGQTPDEVGGFLESELRDHFGVEPAPSRPREFAERLVEWFAATALQRPAPPVPSRHDIEQVFEKVLDGGLTREQASRWATQWVGALEPDVKDQVVWSALRHLGGLDLRHGADQPYLHDEDQVAGWLDDLREGR